MSTTESKAQRHTTTHDRYTISDPVCGLVETATSLKKALARAKVHSNSCPDVEVFDVMARKDCVQVWDADGKILNFRRLGTGQQVTS